MAVEVLNHFPFPVLRARNSSPSGKKCMWNGMRMSTLCEKSVFQFYFCLQPAKKSSPLSVVVSTPNAATAALDNPTVEGSAARPPVQANSETVQPTAITTSPPRKGGISIGSGTTTLLVLADLLLNPL
jgi:hypothetical protein